MQGEGAFVPEKSTECKALKSANPYNILCVMIQKASVNKIYTNISKKEYRKVLRRIIPASTSVVR